MQEKINRIKKLKTLIPYEFDPKYVEADRITFHDVKVTEKIPRYGKPKRTIIIRKLILLNTDEDKEEETVLINKVVIDPAISRDSLSYKIGKYLFSQAAFRYNQQIENITDELSKIKMFEFPKPKPIPSNNTFINKTELQKKNMTEEEIAQNHLNKALGKIKNISIPHIEDNVPLQGVDLEMRSFDEEIDKEMFNIQNITDNKAIYNVASKVENMNKEMQEMAKLWQVHQPEAEKAKKKFQLKMAEMEKSMDILALQMNQIDKQQEDFAQRMREHQKRLNDLLAIHKNRVNKLMDFNKKALEEVDFLNREMAEIDEKQKNLDKVLKRKIKKKKYDPNNPEEIMGVKRGKNPFPKIAIENQKKMANAEIELDLITRQMKDLERSQDKIKKKMEIKKLEKVLKEVKEKSQAAKIRERITYLKKEQENIHNEPVNLTKTEEMRKVSLRHKRVDLMKMIQNIVKNKLVDLKEIKPPTLKPIKIRSLREEKEKLYLERRRKSMLKNPKLRKSVKHQDSPVIKIIKKPVERVVPKIEKKPEKFDLHKEMEKKKNEAIQKRNKIMAMNMDKLNALNELMKQIHLKNPKKT